MTKIKDCIVLNKTVLELRLKETEETQKHLDSTPRERRDKSWDELSIKNENEAFLLCMILAESKPLEPIVSDAFFEGDCHGNFADGYLTKQEYLNKEI